MTWEVGQLPVLCCATPVYTARISAEPAPTPLWGGQQQQARHPHSRTGDERKRSVMHWYLTAAPTAVKASVVIGPGVSER